MYSIGTTLLTLRSAWIDYIESGKVVHVILHKVHLPYPSSVNSQKVTWYNTTLSDFQYLEKSSVLPNIYRYD